MNEADRRIVESPLYQGENEEIPYALDTTNWGTPTNVIVVVKDSLGNDVTSAVTTGSATISGATITLPIIRNLRRGEKYRLEVKFTLSGTSTILEPWADLIGQE